jgi:pSer/pThr/pTyr-binding forkhead associated (FHA) protein
VLLLRDHGDVFAYDLCSTNGTRVAGQRIRRHRLSDAGTTLELGKKVMFRWRR